MPLPRRARRAIPRTTDGRAPRPRGADDALDASRRRDAPGASGPGAMRTRSRTRTSPSSRRDEIALARAALDRLVWTPGERRTRRWVRGRGAARRPAPRARAQPAHGRRRRQLPAAGGARVRARSSCSATSAARWSATRACCCTSPTRLARRHRACRSFVFSTGSRASPRAASPGGSTRRSPPFARRCPTGRAGTRSARRWRLAPALGAARAPWRSGGAAHLRRLGPRRPGVLRHQIRRLQRSCHRLIWLNPLIGTPDYAPLTRGLQAALPFVDDLARAHADQSRGAGGTLERAHRTTLSSLHDDQSRDIGPQLRETAVAPLHYTVIARTLPPFSRATLPFQ